MKRELETDTVQDTKLCQSVPGLADLSQLLSEIEELYRDIHSHPELSMQETTVLFQPGRPSNDRRQIAGALPETRYRAVAASCSCSRRYFVRMSRCDHVGCGRPANSPVWPRRSWLNAAIHGGSGCYGRIHGIAAADHHFPGAWSGRTRSSDAAGATRPPEITVLDHYDMVVNEVSAEASIREAFEDQTQTALIARTMLSSEIAP
jgi:hypothetical protein